MLHPAFIISTQKNKQARPLSSPTLIYISCTWLYPFDNQKEKASDFKKKICAGVLLPRITIPIGF